MVYITKANMQKIISSSNIKDIDIKGEIYKEKIYLFSKYEENELLAVQELLKDPEKYFDKVYKPYKSKDNKQYVYKEQSPAFHTINNCERLTADFINLKIPEIIIQQGLVDEFREWFKTVEHLMDNPAAFKMRAELKWGFSIYLEEVVYKNSGFLGYDNICIEELEGKIDKLLKSAGLFYYSSDKNTIILKRFGKLTFLAYKQESIYNNETGYDDDKVKVLLREYDNEFKKPLKDLLIKYYMLKFNPDIEIKKSLLDSIGFRQCSHCINLSKSEVLSIKEVNLKVNNFKSYNQTMKLIDFIDSI